MAVNPQHRISPAAYLAFERAQTDARHAYLNGEIIAMSGASFVHHIIVSNLVIILGIQMRGRSCNVFASDMRVKIPATGLYTYPDIAALCGAPTPKDDAADTLLNPSVIVEVVGQGATQSLCALVEGQCGRGLCGGGPALRAQV